MIIHYSMAVKGRADLRPPLLEQQRENRHSNRPDPTLYGKVIFVCSRHKTGGKVNAVEPLL